MFEESSRLLVTSPSSPSSFSQRRIGITGVPMEGASPPWVGPPGDRAPRATDRRTFLRSVGVTAGLTALGSVVPAGTGSAWAGPAVPAQPPGTAPGSLSAAVRKFHLHARPAVVRVGEVADALGMARPVSVREVHRRLTAIPTELRLAQVITTEAALGGRAEMVLRSDGTYTSFGSMRATGFPSFAYQVTASVESAGNLFLPMARHEGRVFGTDTPGDRSRSWNESGQSESLRQNWVSVAENARLVVRKEYELSGVLGTVADVAVKIGQFVGLATVVYPGLAAAITLASTLAEATEEPFPLPRLPLGITVAAGVLLVFGPGMIVPAVVAGGVAELAVQHRPLDEAEYAFATKIFGNTLPPREQIILTNMLGKGDRRFVMPGPGGVFFVNLGQAAFDDPMGYRTQGSRYATPGQVFVHELTHTWQGRRLPAVTYFCKGITNSTYTPDADVNRPWADHGLEQQATIVDTWYASIFDPKNKDFLDSEYGRPVPDWSRKAPELFDRYIYGNIRGGIT